MRATLLIAWRELRSYFVTPVASVFIVIFLILSSALTFTIGNFFDRGQADLQPFFGFVPWLFLLLIPALTMRLWAEERRLGTIELLLTLPISLWQAVLGKFLAAWAFCACALALTFPLWLTVNALGSPDNGVIFAGYFGCLLVAGFYLAVGAAVSAMTRNQVIAFVIAVALCFLLTAAGSSIVSEFLSDRLPILAEMARGLSVTDRFLDFTRGLIGLPNLVYFASCIGLALLINVAVLEHRRSS